MLSNIPYLSNDHLGESILFCREAEKAKVEQLISSELEPVSSCLIQESVIHAELRHKQI